MYHFNRALLLLAAATCLLPTISLAATTGSSESTNTNDSSNPNRIVRRVILEGSLTNAGYDGGQASRYSKANGYAVGALFDLLGSGSLVLEMGVLYRQLGTTIDNGLGNNDFTANYISVPASLKYYLSGQERTSLYLKAGVLGSTLISGNQIYITPTTHVGARSWETSFLAGVGLKVDLTQKTGLIGEVDYNRATDSIFPGSDIYRSDITGTLGLALNL